MCWIGNLAKNWEQFQQRFNFFLVGRGDGAKSDRIKTSLLLHVIGDRGIEVYNTFKFEDGDEMKLDNVINAFKHYCTPKTNETAERFKFLSRKQKFDESLQDFITDLKNLARGCSYGDQKENFIRDVLTIGILENSLREKLLRTENLTLEVAEKICRATQFSRQQATTISDGTQSKGAEEEIGMVHQVQYGSPHTSKMYPTGQWSRLNNRNNPIQRHSSYYNSGTPTRSRSCRQCGIAHGLSGLKDACPADGKQCRRCGGDNHFARMCKTKAPKQPVRREQRKVNTIAEQEDMEISDEGEDTRGKKHSDRLYIKSVSKPIGIYNVNNNSSKISNKEWLINVKIGNADNLSLKVDTGAQANVLSFSDFKQITKSLKKGEAGYEYKPTNIKLYDYSNNEIPVKGQCKIPVVHDKREFYLVFVVVDSVGVPLVGLQSAQDLGLIKQVGSITTNGYENVIRTYQDVFKGLGCLQGHHSIDIDPNVRPVVHPCRKVPFSVRKRLKKELDRMSDIRVVVKEDEPTEWVNSVVVAEKKNGQLRVCLDPRNLNKAIRREHFTLPTREDLMGEFAEAKFFSKLDATSGYWQVKLDEASSKLTTFNTPFGRYRYLRLPFGITSAGEVFHKKVRLIFENIPGVVTSMDDVMVSGRTKEEHDERLVEVLKRARQANLKLNPDKCVFGVTKVTFMGDVYSDKGIQPDPKKYRRYRKCVHPQTKLGYKDFWA